MKQYNFDSNIPASINTEGYNEFSCFQAEYTPSIIMKKNSNLGLNIQSLDKNSTNKRKGAGNSKVAQSALKKDLSVIYENSSQFNKGSSIKKNNSKGQNILGSDGNLIVANKISHKNSMPIEILQSEGVVEEAYDSANQLKLVKRISNTNKKVQKIQEMQNQGDHQQLQSKVFINISNPQTFTSIQKNIQSKIQIFIQNCSANSFGEQTFYGCLNTDQISSQMLAFKRKSKQINSKMQSLKSQDRTIQNKLETSIGVSSLKSNEKRPRNLLYF